MPEPLRKMNVSIVPTQATLSASEPLVGPRTFWLLVINDEAVAQDWIEDGTSEPDTLRHLLRRWLGVRA